MPTIFTRIINGELPGRFVWRDARCVAFLTIQPIQPGHVLVVPIAEVEHWLDLEPSLNAHLFGVAQTIGQALQSAYQPEKVGLMVAGLEVPHVHLHLVPINSAADLSFANANLHAKAQELDEAAQTIRASLRAMGATGVVDK